MKELKTKIDFKNKIIDEAKKRLDNIDANLANVSAVIKNIPEKETDIYNFDPLKVTNTSISVDINDPSVLATKIENPPANSKDFYKAERFKYYTNKMYNIFCKKNEDYTGSKKMGSAFDLSYDIIGPLSPAVRFLDKVSRYISFAEGKKFLVKDEKIEDTLIDLANYAILTILKLEEEKEKLNK